ncbi:MbeD family mobilization/exclusion protein, partial [Escherichia coli]|nr:MbeD family mobilization/exclusion protein [Escherichia coli]MSF05348.1 MbeD family mobilization/exclusion protein [Escherichia coli]MSF10298.1 MbeD family mobilization/exclusion protein [Escherichia coli]MSF58300.1 MbeD family mobilization/exclusion protein [Escherichia coli]MSF72746.1 MbeD family mobilization/exclusion protein [Escherichia coli]
MTELERHLLNALEQLQQDYMQRLNEWESAFVELQKMFSLTQRDNAMLNERVMKL